MHYNKTSGKEGILVSLWETTKVFGTEGFLSRYFVSPWISQTKIAQWTGSLLAFSSPTRSFVSASDPDIGTHDTRPLFFL